MTLQQPSAVRQAVHKERRNTVLSRNSDDSRSPVEHLLRDLALVLHATATIRRAMEAEQAACLAIS